VYLGGLFCPLVGVLDRVISAEVGFFRMFSLLSELFIGKMTMARTADHISESTSFDMAGLMLNAYRYVWE